jgi:glutaminyl-peptide cyclotransferase
VKLTRLVLILSLLLCTAPGCSPSAETPTFDRGAAFDLLKKQVDIGPRYPGVGGHAACRDFIVSQLKPYADEVRVQDFKQSVAGKTLSLSNITALFNPKAKSFILLAAHWDTRPLADMEVDPARQAKPILGANDGASEVAVLLELARLFKQRQPDVGVMMVFFDGEDYATNPPSADTMFLGSKYFAGHLDPKTKQAIRYGILLDMIGDKNLGIYEEAQSLAAAPEVVKKVWDTAKSLGYEKSFIASSKYSISDDHIPLIKAGVKCIDVIDFDYAPWHTLDDTVDKCSPDSLGIVGDVIAKVVYQEKTP